MLQDALEAEACEIVWNSLEQLEKSVLEDIPFDLILIELLNPVEIFFELISAIKARSPRTEVIHYHGSPMKICG